MELKTSKTIGGKARNLKKLQKLGINVPKFVVISSEELNEILPLSVQYSKDVNVIKEAIDTLDLSESSLEKYLAKWKHLPERFAVRSSSIQEDGEQQSFAGQFESYLGVKQDDLESKIKLVWKSLYAERVQTYSNSNGIELNHGIAVIIQEMVESDVSGVAFGINPLNGEREQVINAVNGLGEGLVNGDLNSDTYYIKDGQLKGEEIVRKEFAYQYAEKGVEKIKLKTNQTLKPCLDEKACLEISNLLIKLEKHFGKAQDIEFAYKNEVFYLLQTRPVTIVVNQKTDHFIVWDNSNIIESYPGLSSPLTFSFIIDVYAAVYKQLLSLLGVSAKLIEQNTYTFDNMLGLLKGRVYYNLLSWYQALSLLPGYKLNASFMEKMMGVKERFELDQDHYLSKRGAYWAVFKSVLNILRNLISLPKQRKDFQEKLDEVIIDYKKKDFEQQEAHKTMYDYLSFESILLKEWKAPMVNDFFAMIFFGVLQKMLEKKNVRLNLHNELLSGSDDVISTEPVERIVDIVKAIQENEEWKYAFKNEEPYALWLKVLLGDKDNVQDKVLDYIDKFGDRCVGELQLETETYHQKPQLFIQLLQSYVRKGILHELKTGNEQKVRKDATKEARKLFKGPKRILFNWILKTTRKMVSNRENLRYERTRAFGMTRKMFLGIGRQFEKDGIIHQQRDIFFLEKKEIFDIIKGTAIQHNPKTLIDLRKATYDEYELETIAERIETNGIVYNNRFDLQNEALIEGDLKGVACCSGQVTAKVRVVKDPTEVESLDGDILVTSSTDPAWVILFPSASAILVERGSLLSHSAIVSREMGIPCIVGISGLLSRLKTGDLVQMDGATGLVKIIENEG